MYTCYLLYIFLPPSLPYLSFIKTNTVPEDCLNKNVIDIFSIILAEKRAK